MRPCHLVIVNAGKSYHCERSPVDYSKNDLICHEDAGYSSCSSRLFMHFRDT